MLRDWIYNHSTLEIGAVIVALSVVAAWLGLFVFDRFVDVSVRRRHNDVAGFIIAIIGVVYAVLLAFIAVAAWANFDNANRVVQQEANLVDNLYRDAIAIPEPARSAVREDIKQYLRLVIDEEWPAQRQHKADTSGWVAIEKLQSAVAALDPKTLGQSVVEAEMLKTLNDLYSARRTRLLAASDGIPNTIWSILVLGGVITIAFSFFFGMHSMVMHYAMTGTLAASLALVMVLIVALDWPFRGEVSISPEAFTTVQQDIAQQEQQAHR